MGWKMVRHAFGMVFGNLPHALRASAVPMVIGIVLTLVVFYAFGVDYSAIQRTQMGEPVAPEEMAGILPAVILLLIVYLFIFGWVAVTWHRFILLEEYPSFLPPVAGRPIWNYAGKAMLVGLIIGLVSIPLLFVLGLLITPFALSGNMAVVVAAGAVLGVILGTVLAWVWYRIAVVLPGTAVGKPMRIGDGWRATKVISKDIFVMGLILVGINVGISLIVSPIVIGMPLIGNIISLIVNWVTLMVGASVLTTVYGHVIEGRPLVD